MKRVAVRVSLTSVNLDDPTDTTEVSSANGNMSFAHYRAYERYLTEAVLSAGDAAAAVETPKRK